MTPFPLTRQQLIDIRDGNKRNEDVRALLLEIKRLHDIIRQADDLRKTIDKSWAELTPGKLTALHRLRNLLSVEVERLPYKPPSE